MNICIISSAFPSKKNPIINIFIYRQAKALAERGHKVFVVAGDTESRKESNMIVYARPKAIKSLFLALKIALKIPRDFFWLLKNIGLKGTIGRLALVEIASNLLKREEIDIIDGQWADYGGAVAYLVSKIWKKPYIVSALGSEVAEIADGVVGILPLKRVKILRKVLENADCIITVSKSLADDVKKYCSREPIILPWGIDLNLFKPHNEKVFKRRTIVCVGALVKRKGHEFLLKAFKKVLNCINDVDLLIIGWGPEEQELKKLVNNLGITDNVRFIDYVETSEFPKYYSSSEFFVSATLHEGFGVVFAEAMACGLPIVSTNVGAVPEVVGEAGILVEPKNPEQLAEAMLKLLNDSKLREELSKKALERASRFSIEKRTEDLEKIYERYRR